MTAWLLLNTMFTAPLQTAAGLGLMLLGLPLARPMAWRLMLRAAVMYCSRKAGEVRNTAAMLSNPSLETSLGSMVLTSTSSPSIASIERAYSVRFRRWSPTLPGAGCSPPAASNWPSIQWTKESMVCWSGCG